ncbi:MAG: hypothetical protein COT14_01375 [Candidatus Diapherotrites archaeon CG08_land_8_20_14_0_20_30_16]|nr:MAG: hypothetical protein COT14_01375 [Candidatus Diapherotrites archaeon CG08_land_8_20_14_0_20_30_16]
MWLVNGRAVRDLFYTDFTHGGNDKVYKFVPKYEIWLDDNLSPAERRFAAVHELYERNTMAYKKLCYDDSHDLASELELFYRHNPKNVMKRIRYEAHRAKDDC